MSDEQKDLFGWSPPSWEKEWVGMPEYNQENVEPEMTATFKFRSEDDFNEFRRLIRKHVYKENAIFNGGAQKEDAKHSWFPLLKKASHYAYLDRERMKHPQFPIYIVSKGRWLTATTPRVLKGFGVDFYVIVEENEYQKYLQAGVVSADRLLILPQSFKDNYDTFWNDGDSRTGSGAARNFAWEHSIRNGFSWHWCMDDNIDYFSRLNNNLKARMGTGTGFKVMEDFVLRYNNVAIAGPHYQFFVLAKNKLAPYVANCRIFSCLLIRNDIPFRWRGRYNEDVDLSIRALKAGWATIQFNAFLQGKTGTMVMEGGNTEELYGEGTKTKSQMLVDMHPDITRLVHRFGRWHHHVDYSAFRYNKLGKDQSLEAPLEKIDNFGMYITRTKTTYENHKTETKREKGLPF